MTKLALIGFMGSGKTTVGKHLAALLSFRFIDTDDVILEISGAESIADIFKLQGEAAFRGFEKQAIQNLCKQNEDLVIAGGGGLIIDQGNRELLRQNSTIIYLDTSFETIRKRVEKEIAERKLIRPLFTDPEQAKELYESRLQVYINSANITVNTEKKSPAEVAKEIQSVL